MPFLAVNTLHTDLKSRKEYMDFSPTRRFLHHFSILKYHSGRASVSTSGKGSVTVEASLVLPLFFFGVICMLALFEMEATKLTVKNSLQCVGQETAYQDYGKDLYLPVTTAGELRKMIGDERLDRSWIVGGKSGISCARSFRRPDNHEYIFAAEYRVRMPFSVFGIPPVKQKVSLTIKGWNGYQALRAADTDNIIVYVTKHGTVYHRDCHCTYLDLSIHTASLETINEKRNRYQEKYHPCEYCGAWAAGIVYITDMGNRYHADLRCSGLKRQIQTISLNDIGERRPCSRCGY